VIGLDFLHKRFLLVSEMSAECKISGILKPKQDRSYNDKCKKPPIHVVFYYPEKDTFHGNAPLLAMSGVLPHPIDNTL